MKFLETRTEIAKAINFKQYPTIRIDVSKTCLLYTSDAADE